MLDIFMADYGAIVSEAVVDLKHVYFNALELQLAGGGFGLMNTALDLELDNTAHDEADDHFDKLREECGVMAIYNHSDAARLTYWGLYALQHRGQESAGIASADGGFGQRH